MTEVSIGLAWQTTIIADHNNNNNNNMYENRKPLFLQASEHIHCNHDSIRNGELILKTITCKIMTLFEIF